MKLWRLTIDESGNFGDAAESVVVGGWLSQDYDTHTSRASLRRAIVQAFPRAQYPPHGSVHKRSVSQLWGCNTSGSIHRADMSVAGPLIAARASGHPDVEAVLRGLADDRALGRAEGWLADHKAEQRCLDAMRRGDRERFHSTLKSVEDRFPQFRGCHWLAAAEPGISSPLQVRVAPDAHRRYLVLLAAALERAREIVFLEGEQSVIVVSVGERSDGRRLLTRREIEPVLAKASVARVSFVLRSVEAYGKDVHPGIVLADFFTNDLRARINGNAVLAWLTLTKGVKQSLRLPLHGVYARRLPVVTAAPAALSRPPLAKWASEADAIWRAL